jgi:hypothetical protein
LIGFWSDGEATEQHALEALVVGRTLDHLSLDALEDALATATRPRDPDRKLPFFEDAPQARRK